MVEKNKNEFEKREMRKNNGFQKNKMRSDEVKSINKIKKELKEVASKINFYIGRYFQQEKEKRIKFRLKMLNYLLRNFNQYEQNSDALLKVVDSYKDAKLSFLTRLMFDRFDGFFINAYQKNKNLRMVIRNYVFTELIPSLKSNNFNDNQRKDILEKLMEFNKNILDTKLFALLFTSIVYEEILKDQKEHDNLMIEFYKKFQKNPPNTELNKMINILLTVCLPEGTLEYVSGNVLSKEKGYNWMLELGNYADHVVDLLNLIKKYNNLNLGNKYLNQYIDKFLASYRNYKNYNYYRNNRIVNGPPYYTYEDFLLDLQKASTNEIVNNYNNNKEFKEYFKKYMKEEYVEKMNKGYAILIENAYAIFEAIRILKDIYNIDLMEEIKNEIENKK